jgi:hypothetical protein
MCEFCDMLRNKVVELENENVEMKRELSILRLENKVKDEQIRTFRYSTRYVFQGEPIQQLAVDKSMPFKIKNI